MCSAGADLALCAALQTAHDQGYLVKHLLSGLPNVAERVKNMRQARNGTAEDNKNRMFASQEAYIKVQWCLHLMSRPCAVLCKGLA